MTAARWSWNAHRRSRHRSIKRSRRAGVKRSFWAKAGIAALKAKVKGGMFALARAEKDMVHHDKKQGGYAAIVESGRVTFLHCSKCEN